MKVFILSPNVDTLFTPELKKKLKSSGEVIIDKKPRDISKVKALFQGDEQRILALDPDFTEWKVNNGDIKKIPNLKAICLQTTSFSWIDVDYVKKLNIPVINLRGFSSKAVAEWAILMTFNVARKVPLVIKEDWKYDYSKHKGIEIFGKTAGVVGMGSIGTNIAEKCKGLGMKVVYWSKNTRDNRFKYMKLEKLMKTADVIYPAVARNEKTAGLVTDKMIKGMKKSAIFVSVVHDVYNHKLLLKQADKNEIYGYAFEEESKVTFNKYKGNVWAGPQLAWATDGSMKRNAEQWVESVVSASKGSFKNRVN